jgi:hypothetical protein
MLCHHFLADLDNSSGIMEQTISSLISKCQMAAQLHRYLIIAKKRVHCQPVYAHFSGVSAYTGSQCIAQFKPTSFLFINSVHQLILQNNSFSACFLWILWNPWKKLSANFPGYSIIEPTLDHRTKYLKSARLQQLTPSLRSMPVLYLHYFNIQLMVSTGVLNPILTPEFLGYPLISGSHYR